MSIVDWISFFGALLISRTFEFFFIFSFCGDDHFLGHKNIVCSQKMYSLIEWKGENLVNVYALSRILSPRKELCDYKVRDVVKAKFGNGVYEATILELSGK